LQAVLLQCSKLLSTGLQQAKPSERDLFTCRRNSCNLQAKSSSEGTDNWRNSRTCRPFSFSVRSCWRLAFNKRSPPSAISSPPGDSPSTSEAAGDSPSTSEALQARRGAVEEHSDEAQNFCWEGTPKTLKDERMNALSVRSVILLSETNASCRGQGTMLSAYDASRTASPPSAIAHHPSE